MNIRVLYFSRLREVAGVTGENFDLRANAGVADVIAHATKIHPAITPYLPALLVTRNEEWSDREATLAEGDVIGLMPPVSGG